MASRRKTPARPTPHPTEPGVLMIPLSNGGHAIVDEADLCRVDEYTWFAFRYRDPAKERVLYAMCHQTRTFLHRHLMGLTKGDSRIFVDHKNHDGLDNRRRNLRLATRRQNAANRLKTSGLTSKFKGVSWHGQQSKWTANIGVSIEGRKYKIGLGLYAIEAEAAFAYQVAAPLLRDPEFLHPEPIPPGVTPTANRRAEIREAVLAKIKAGFEGRKGRLGAASQYRGVAYNPESSNWRASICIDRKAMKVGNYPTEHEAGYAYEVAASLATMPRTLSGQDDPKPHIEPPRRDEIRRFVVDRVALLRSGRPARSKPAPAAVATWSLP